MRHWIWKIAFFIFCVFLALLFCYLFFYEKKNHSELTLYGNVDVRVVDIGFRVDGRVKELFFQEGDLVHKGDLLCTLEKTPYDSEYNKAKADVDAVFSQLKLAENLFLRRQELVCVGGVSQEDFDEARSKVETLTSELEQKQAMLAVQADYLDYTEVFAPNDGVIFTRVREVGSAVKAGDPIYTLSLSNPIWIRSFVEEPDLGKIAYGMDAEVFTDTKGAPSYRGKIGFISPMAEFTPKTVETPQLRTDLVYRIRVYIDHPDWRLKQGMPVTIKIDTSK